jgi:hypothetical protein
MALTACSTQRELQLETRVRQEKSSRRRRGSWGYDKRRTIDRARESWGGAVKYRGPALALHHTRWMAYGGPCAVHAAAGASSASKPGSGHSPQPSLPPLVLWCCIELPLQANDTTHQYRGLYYHPVCGSLHSLQPDGSALAAQPLDFLEHHVMHHTPTASTSLTAAMNAEPPSLVAYAKQLLQHFMSIHARCAGMQNLQHLLARATPRLSH